MKYDRLGVNDALLQFESDLGERSLPEPDCLLPALDQLAADSRFLNIARQRARSLAQRIRSAEDLPLGPPSSQTQQDPQAPQSPANAQNP
jgi:hypothetical protein